MTNLLLAVLILLIIGGLRYQNLIFKKLKTMATKVEELNEKLDQMQVVLDDKQAKIEAAIAGFKQMIADLQASNDGALQPLIDKAGVILADIESTPEA